MFSSKKQGFTLIEVMITMSVLGILLAIAVPSYLEATARQSMIDEGEGLVAAINLARSNAIQSNQIVTLAATNSTSSQKWCFGAKKGSVACDCTSSTAQTDCNAGLYQNINSKITSNFGTDLTANDTVIDPVRGLISKNITQFTLSNNYNQTIKFEINNIGIATRVK